ncbi:MAG: M23 family metallopeptidase [Rhodospirillaceae bacterium]
MDLILVARKQAETKTYTLRLPDVLFLMITSLLVVAALSASVTRMVLDERARMHAAFETAASAPSAEHETDVAPAAEGTDLRQVAARVAQMQSQLVRLDKLSDRLTRMVGFSTDELLASDENAGGRFDAVPPPVMTLAGLMRQVDVLFRQFDDRRDMLGALESLFALDDVRRKLLPTSLPLETGAYSSDFGWRTDPFTNERNYHEGIDFTAEHGAPILAAAGGVVVYSAFHPQYGNMLEIDHGNGLVTRYAHAAKRLARVGDVVTRGAQIGEVGSSGRSTGNHLHFEVRRNGAPLNPAQFLRLRG